MFYMSFCLKKNSVGSVRGEYFSVRRKNLWEILNLDGDCSPLTIDFI